MKYIEGSIKLGDKIYTSRIAVDDVDDEAVELVEKATYDNKVAELQAVIDDLQETGGSGSGSSGSGSVDLSILEDLTFTPVSEGSSQFYVTGEGMGLVLLDIDNKSVETIGQAGHDYRVIKTESMSLLIEDDSKIYIMGEEENTEIQYNVANAEILPWHVSVNKMLFIPIVVSNSTYKTIIISEDTQVLLDVVDFRLGIAVDGVRTEISDSDVLVFSPDCLQALHVRRDWENDNYDSLLYKNVISVSNANKITEYVEAVYWTENFSILRGYNGLWKVTNTSVEKIAAGEDYQLMGGDEIDGVYYALFENSTSGLRVSSEDGTYESYTPVHEEISFGETNWESEFGIGIYFYEDGTYIMTDEEGKYIDENDLEGTYSFNSEWNSLTLTGGSSVMEMEYMEEDGVLMLYNDDLGEVYFYQK